MKKEKSYYAALGVIICELLKCAYLTNDDVCKALKIGHDPLNGLKKG